MDSFVDLQQQRYLPPDGTAASLLDTRFLVADTPDEAELLVSDPEPDLDANVCPAVLVPTLQLTLTLKIEVTAAKLAHVLPCTRRALHDAGCRCLSVHNCTFVRTRPCHKLTVARCRNARFAG